MRRLPVLLVLVLVLAACNGDDADATDTEEPAVTPTPTEIVADPEPTPADDDGTIPEQPTPTPEQDLTDEETAEFQALVDQIVENVVELRGLEMIEELEFALMSRAELTEMLEEEVVLEPAEIDLFWLLRLIDDRDIDLEQVLIDAQAADIYGFYDPESKETYVIAEDEELSALEEVILAHEIVHALQDQHFGLQRLEDLEPDYDAVLAFRSVVEGDAVLTQELYAQRYLDEDRQAEYMQEAMAATQDPAAQAALDELPEYFMEQFSFPYVAGAQFVIQMFDGDFDRINDQLEDPPVTTQQIMGASRYLGGELGAPVEIELPELHDQLGDDWELYDEGTTGVFDLELLLELNGVEDGREPTAGWRGSVFSLYEDGDDALLLLSTEWDSPDSAGAFEAALVQTMEGYDESDGVWSGDARFHSVSVQGTNVQLTSSSSEDALRNVTQ